MGDLMGWYLIELVESIIKKNGTIYRKWRDREEIPASPNKVLAPIAGSSAFYWLIPTKHFEDMMAVMKVRRRYLLVRGAKLPAPVARWTLGTTSRFYFARRPQKLLSFFTSLSLMSPIDHLQIC